MGIAELKEQLHKKIEALNDMELLGAVNEILAHNQVFQIPKKYLPGIAQGMQDFNNNEFITLEQIENRYKAWLKD